MAENACEESGCSNSHVEEEALEQHRLNGTDRKKKSTKRKAKYIEEKKSTKEKEYSSTRFLYNETPSDDEEESERDEEESERVLPSPKKRVKTNGDSKKPPPFSKVWSDEDEISILRGIIKFKEETGHDARQNMVEFRAFILESLNLQATLVQLREKVRRMREKYEKTSVGNGNGSRTQHEVELFRLCEKIWTVGPKQVTEQPNSSGTGHPEQKKKKKQNIPEIRPHSIISETGVDVHSIIPETGVDVQTLQALMKRLSDDTGLVINSKAWLRGNQKEVDIRVLDLHQENMRLILKLLTLVQEKAKSPELRDSPELLEQEVLRAYLEAKIKYTQLLLNAYTGFIKVGI
ncbi:hypothetical protein HAX54_044966 [Datura stramonium]|uniref:Glabrous enhancer-binding protein-like DBD domain-containing protein n=1 Tax=Datura stramonium TaxID=4076 RepID=A0ABS8WIY6_DATST|nr:hypothetical protein [Datura stramonium]